VPLNLLQQLVCLSNSRMERMRFSSIRRTGTLMCCGICWSHGWQSLQQRKLHNLLLVTSRQSSYHVPTSTKNSRYRNKVTLSSSLSRRFPLSSFSSEDAPTSNQAMSERTEGSDLTRTLSSTSTSSSDPFERPKFRIYYNDVYEVPLPPGHRFPMKKYRIVRERVQQRLKQLAEMQVHEASMADIGKIVAEDVRVFCGKKCCSCDYIPQLHPLMQLL
jgi:hypothetical protein